MREFPDVNQTVLLFTWVHIHISTLTPKAQLKKAVPNTDALQRVEGSRGTFVYFVGYEKYFRAVQKRRRAKGMSTYLLNSGSLSRSSRAECVVIFEGLNSEISSSILRPIRLAGKHQKLRKHALSSDLSS